MRIQIDTVQKQTQTLSQQQLQFLSMLAMTNQELSEFMEQEFLENPLLEKREAPSAPGQAVRSHQPAVKELAAVTTESEDVTTMLTEQLNYSRYSAIEWSAIQFLIGCLEDNGFFTLPLSQAAFISGISEDILERMLLVLKTLEPNGIFSSGLEECLLSQLNKDQLLDPFLIEMIKNHMPDILKGRISTITRALKLSTVQVRQNIAIISSLTPYPLAGYGKDINAYIVPDIICTPDEDGWQITINDEWFGSYEISDYYLRMMQEANDAELKQYFKTRYQRAGYLLQNIESRRTSMTRITAEILELQQAYFIEGKELIPMTMEQIANKLQISVSTVSRAIKQKYLQTPGGIILMKQLFSQAVAKENTSASLTSQQIKTQIAALIEAEDKQAPLSDQQIVDLLITHNIRLSRRAAAKYREALGIPTSYNRKV